MASSCTQGTVGKVQLVTMCEPTLRTDVHPYSCLVCMFSLLQGPINCTIQLDVPHDPLATTLGVCANEPCFFLNVHRF